MCRIFASQDPATYASVTRSIRLCGHATSIRLESRFWDILEEIADHEALALPKFLNVLYSEALEAQGNVANFASLLRVACLVYLAGRANYVASLAARQALGARTPGRHGEGQPHDKIVAAQ